MTDFPQLPLDNSPIKACIISLGSNYHPEYYLSQVRKRFEQNFILEKFATSEIIISQDSHSLQNPTTYYNQMAVVYFQQSISLTYLIQASKQIELSLDRKKFDKPIVTIDIDILAFGIPKSEILYDCSENTLIAVKDNTLDWYKISRRFPLATYEKAGLENLANQHSISSQFLTALLN